MTLDSRQERIIEVVAVALVLGGVILLLATAGCGAPEVQVERAWGSGGVELDVDGRQLVVEVRESGVAVPAADGGEELVHCTYVAILLHVFAFEGELPAPLSDERCFKAGDEQPFGPKAHTIVVEPAEELD